MKTIENYSRFSICLIFQLVETRKGCKDSFNHFVIKLQNYVASQVKQHLRNTD